MELEGITQILMDQIARGKSGANLNGCDGKNLAHLRRALTCCFFVNTNGRRILSILITTEGGSRRLEDFALDLLFLCLGSRGGRTNGGI